MRYNTNIKAGYLSDNQPFVLLRYLSCQIRQRTA